MTRTFTSRIAALALVLGLAGCSLLPGTGDDEPASTATTSAGVTAPDEAGKSTASMRFDVDYCEWDNGVVVNASTPIHFRPSPQATPVSGVGVPMEVTVTVVNHSGAPYGLKDFTATLLSGGREAAAIIDPLNRLDGAPVTATVANGAALEVPLGFYVADPEDVVLKVAPGRDCDWAYFTY